MAVRAAEHQTAIGAVRVWVTSLDQLADRAGDFRSVLAGDERARADRFYFERDRRRFVVCRGVLRMLLSDELDVDPGRIEFSYGPYGKPSIASPRGRDVKFNVSHSDGLALFAVTAAAEVGIDLERVRPLDDLQQVAESVFSARERAELASLPASDRTEGFFIRWTRKEAFVKARGDGLQHRLDSFDVTLAPGAPASLVRVAGDPGACGRWSLSSFEPRPGFTAAICVERPFRF